jgi:hypothetical protein
MDETMPIPVIATRLMIVGTLRLVRARAARREPFPERAVEIGTQGA